MASEAAKSLWESLFNVVKNEEAWIIIDKCLESERLAALGEDFVKRAARSDCACRYVDGTLKMCEYHAVKVIRTLDNGL